jgi:hypothetical protein
VRVKLTHDGGTEAMSEVFDVRVVPPISQSDLDLVAALQDPLQDQLDAITDPADIVDKVNEILEAVQNADGVADAGRSDSGLGVWIIYESGLLGVVYAPQVDVKSGGRAGVAPVPGGGRVVEGTAPSPKPDRYAAAYRPGFPRRSLAKAALEKDLIKSSKVFGIAAQWFDWGDASDDVPDMVKSLQDKGCYDVTYVKYASKGSGSVEDFKGLGGYGIVLVSSHGDSFFSGIPFLIAEQFKWNGPFGQVVLHTNAAYDDAQALVYQDDLAAKRLVKWGKHFGVLPSFIRRYSGGMPNSLVYMSICRGAWNATMANAFLDKGAGAYLGYSDYVAVSFCRTNGLKTLTELCKPDGSLQTGWTPGIKETDADPAEYRLYGNRDLSIENTGLKDGDFEGEAIEQAWTREGDARRIPVLGDAVPTNGAGMGIISTGLGFTTDSGTLSQVFCAPANAATFEFDWNFFSEEFLEYVGSQYQDGFVVTLENAKDGSDLTTVYNETIDSINASFALAKTSNGFDRGDVYATGWKHFSVAFPAALAGKPVRLKFRTFDVGDSIYDTAILIDQVKLTTSP